MSTPMDECSRHRQFEDQFLRQVRASAATLTKGELPADRVEVVSMPDGVDSVRAELSRLTMGRDMFERMPGTRTLEFRFRRRILGGLFRRTVARLRAQVLAPIESLARGQEPGPVGREQVLDALARYELLPRRERPTAAVFASATGFTAEARALVEAGGPPSLILMGGRADGGWDVSLPPALRGSPWAKLFELETQDERLKRLLYHLEQDAHLLDSRGLSIPVLAEKLGVSPARTEALVRQACRSESRLMTVVHDGTVHVCRTPLGEEGNAMSIRSRVWSRMRKLLRLKPTVAERVRELTAQRVRLEQQRHEIDQKTDKLEAEERQALQQGAKTASDAERKQLASKLMRVRRDLRRQRAQANIFTQQIDIIGTHVHHLTLAEQGKRLELPKAEDLTREAAEAEHVISGLAANADLARSIEVTGETPLMEQEEADIMAEFQQLADSRVAAEAAPAEASSAPAEPAGERPGTPPLPEKKESARPEMG
ncbi:MAG: hypothetical protein KKB50_17595 [Planctomycetes bacterium]|nr:hypothetical protein [Planctomycetota bacterium]